MHSPPACAEVKELWTPKKDDQGPSLESPDYRLPFPHFNLADGSPSRGSMSGDGSGVI